MTEAVVCPWRAEFKYFKHVKPTAEDKRYIVWKMGQAGVIAVQFIKKLGLSRRTVYNWRNALMNEMVPLDVSERPPYLDEIAKDEVCAIVMISCTSARVAGAPEFLRSITMAHTVDFIPPPRAGQGRADLLRRS